MMMTHDKIVGFLLGVGLGTMIGLILRPNGIEPQLPAARDKVDITSEDSFPASEALAF